MLAYTFLWYLHVTCVVVSGSGFVVRGIWMVLDSPLLQQKWVRIVPHIVDTLLLGSAIGLTIVIGQYPFVHGWLTVKLLALVAYIVLGAIALRRGRTRRIRLTAFVAAIAVFLWIVTVARTHHPAGAFWPWI